MRNQGQGHIRGKRRRKGRELKFDLGRDPVTGKRRIRYHSVRGTKKEAARELTRLLAAASTGEHIDPSKITLGEFLDRWERDWAAVNVSPKTQERYGELLRKHVRQHIGGVLLQKLRPVHLAELYAKLSRDTGLAPRTILHVHRVLHRALGHAGQWGLVRQNVAKLVDPSRVPATEIAILRSDELAMLERLRGRALYPIAITALGTGMRRGELVALRWQDVDLDRGVIRVEQSLEATKGRLRFKSPKTKYGRRSIAIPASLVAELHGHQKGPARATAGPGARHSTARWARIRDVERQAPPPGRPHQGMEGRHGGDRAPEDHPPQPPPHSRFPANRGRARRADD